MPTWLILLIVVIVAMTIYTYFEKVPTQTRYIYCDHCKANFEELIRKNGDA